MPGHSPGKFNFSVGRNQTKFFGFSFSSSLIRRSFLLRRPRPPTNNFSVDSNATQTRFGRVHPSCCCCCKRFAAAAVPIAAAAERPSSPEQSGCLVQSSVQASSSTSLVCSNKRTRHWTTLKAKFCIYFIISAQHQQFNTRPWESLTSDHWSFIFDAVANSSWSAKKRNFSKSGFG